MQIKLSTIAWIAFFVLLFTFIYLVNNILMPFVFGAIVAYFLDPLVDRVEETSLSRTISTIIVLSAFALVLVAVLLLLGPIFLEQFKNLSENIPILLSSNEGAPSWISSQVNELAPNLQEKIKDFFYQFSVQIVQATSEILKSIISSGGAVINFISLLIISPIISFYLLRDYDLIVKKIDDLLPRATLTSIREEFSKIDEIISSYLRGQITVCLIMAFFYSVSLGIIQLNYAIAIGIITGILTFIPYAGMAIGMVIGLIVAYFQFGFEGYGLIFTLLVFAMGNFIEGTFITPNLVGEKVRLHPAWIIFALLAGGSLMGFTGVLIAIPAAAVIGVLTRTSIDKYISSSVYHGYPIMKLEKPKAKSSSYDEVVAKSTDRVVSKQDIAEKRGRGRPRKTDAEKVHAQGRRPIDDPPKKRGRGRPRKDK